MDYSLCVYSDKESYLTVAEVDTALSRMEVICNSSNVVEEKSEFKLVSATVTAFGE